MKKVTNEKGNKKIVKRTKKPKVVIDNYLVVVLCEAGHVEGVYKFPSLKMAELYAEEILKRQALELL